MGVEIAARKRCYHQGQGDEKAGTRTTSSPPAAPIMTPPCPNAAITCPRISRGAMSAISAVHAGRVMADATAITTVSGEQR